MQYGVHWMFLYQQLNTGTSQDIEKEKFKINHKESIYRKEENHGRIYIYAGAAVTDARI